MISVVMKRRARRLAHSECGAAMVEFALVLPLLLLLVSGIIDFGRALFVLNNLTNAAREGARFAAAQAALHPTDAAVRTETIARVQSFVNGMYHGATPTTVNVAVTVDAPGAATQGITVTIVGFPFETITPLPALMGLDEITMPDVSAVFRWEGAMPMSP